MQLPYTYKETRNFEKGFSEYYAKHILPLKDQFDLDRKKICEKEPRNKLYAVILSTLSVTGLIFTAKFWAPRSGRYAGKLIVVTCMGIWWAFVGKHRSRYFQTT